MKQYKRITDYLDHDSEFSEEEKKTSNELLLAAHLNLAMSYIKMEEFTQAVEACDKVSTEYHSPSWCDLMHLGPAPSDPFHKQGTS